LHFELFGKKKNQSSAPPIVAAKSRTNQKISPKYRVNVAYRVAGLDAGADDYLTKPFAPYQEQPTAEPPVRRQSAAEPAHCAVGARFGDLVR